MGNCCSCAGKKPKLKSANSASASIPIDQPTPMPHPIMLIVDEPVPQPPLQPVSLITATTSQTQTDFIVLLTRDMASQTDVTIDENVTKIEDIKSDEKDSANVTVEQVKANEKSTIHSVDPSQQQPNSADLSLISDADIISPKKKEKDPNQGRLDGLAQRLNIDDDINKLGESLDSALDISNKFQNFSSSDESEKISKSNQEGEKNVQQTKELGLNDSDENKEAPPVSILNDCTGQEEIPAQELPLKASTENAVTTELSSEEKIESSPLGRRNDSHGHEEDSVPELNESIDFKRLDQFTKRKVSITLDKLEESNSSAEAKTSEPIDSSVVVTKVVQAYNIYKKTVEKNIKKTLPPPPVTANKKQATTQLKSSDNSAPDKSKLKPKADTSKKSSLEAADPSPTSFESFKVSQKSTSESNQQQQQPAIVDFKRLKNDKKFTK